MSYQFQEEALLEVREKKDEPKNLVVFNDDFNTLNTLLKLWSEYVGTQWSKLNNVRSSSIIVVNAQ